MIPPVKMLKNVIYSEESAIQFLFQEGVIKMPSHCSTCGNSGFSIDRKQWRCTKKDCRKKVSLFNGTFFSLSKLPINEVIEFSYYWLAGIKSSQLGLITGHSTNTISNYSSYLRQLVADSLDFEDLIIGGPGIIVEIDESKFGKNKYHRGHPVNGAWILGGVERTENRRIFLIEVPDRTAETLISIIKRYVREGSIIITDCFSSYNNLHQYYDHFQVNHSIEFVDSETGAHTNTIEGTWNAIKYRISPRNRTSSINKDGEITNSAIDEFLLEFQWRRKNVSNLRLRKGFLDALKTVFYI